jgi:hypothetical protein
MADSPRLFKHFPQGSAERTRITFVLWVFGLTLFIIGFLLIVGHFRHKEQYEVRLSNLADGFPLQIRQLRETKYPSEELKDEALVRTGIVIFKNIMDKRYDSGDSNDKKILDELINKFLRPISISQATDDERWGETLTEYSRSLIAMNYPLVHYRGVLIVWLVAGTVYWLVIFLLYNLGLNPGVGEPAFNIIDVGLLAFLIQYTGGIFSLFIFLYSFSLLLASLDFGARRNDDHLKDRNPLAQLALVLGPYVFAIVFTLFWATSERLFSGEMRLSEYLLQWAVVSLVAVALFRLFYIVGLHYFPGRLIKPYSQGATVISKK